MEKEVSLVERCMWFLVLGGSLCVEKVEEQEEEFKRDAKNKLHKHSIRSRAYMFECKTDASVDATCVDTLDCVQGNELSVLFTFSFLRFWYVQLRDAIIHRRLGRSIAKYAGETDKALSVMHDKLHDCFLSFRVRLSNHKPFDCRKVWITSYAPVAL